MPRPRHFDTPTRVGLSLPESVATELELLLHDPRTGIPKVGARSKLLSGLLRKFFQAYATGATNINIAGELAIVRAIQGGSKLPDSKGPNPKLTFPAKYQALWICQVAGAYRVKDSLEEDSPLHRGSFPTVEAAMAAIDRFGEEE